MTDLPRATSGRPAVDVARDAATLAGDILLRRFDQVKHVAFKGRGNVVTDVDTEVEAAVAAFLRREYPDMGFLGEETAGSREDDGYVWIVDPLDGTRNYASGIPFYSVVVALAVDGEPVVGVNYDPTRGEMFVAEKGRGAFLNGARLEVSKRTALEDSIIGMDLSYSEYGGANGLDVLREIWPDMQTARIMGSAALGTLLRRRGTDRPLLPPQPRAVGPGGGPAAGARGRRRRHRPQRSPRGPAQRRTRRLQRGAPQRVHAAHRGDGLATADTLIVPNAPLAGGVENRWKQERPRYRGPSR